MKPARTFDPPEYAPADRFEAMHKAIIAARALRRAPPEQQSVATEAFDDALSELERIERYLGIPA